MSIEEIVYLATQGNAPLTAIVGDRVFPAKAPAGAAKPYVTFSRVSTVPTPVHDGISALDDVLIQFSCWADTYAGAHDLAVAVRAALDDVITSNPPNAPVRGRFEDDGDLPSLDENTFGRRLDVAFWIQP